MIYERSFYAHSHTRVLYLDSDIRTKWFGQDKYALSYALDISKRYVTRANQYPLLGGCDVRTHSRGTKAIKEAPSGFSFERGY